ncbi:hypothetical protein PV05_06104 [Exophiala xenobiotica]|uniref:Uncharacterized protein n=1 Tax=Exophiala xenobiotica TaxID=348802 RepID=A0A0D2EPT3_9EURO|nr:uncharacterized protein PV05_06104 [Exophiala xenobiotica]KIW57563.1 hypothetical protein PV05_06104 [Exophiala xenobiotica]
MFTEQDHALEAIRITGNIIEAHDEYEQAHSMQGSDREVNSALYAATNRLCRWLHALHQIQPENPGLMRMIEDFGLAEKGHFRGHEDWDQGACKRRIHKYAHYFPAESDSEDEGGGGGDDSRQGDEDRYAGYDNDEYQNGNGNGDDYDYSQGFGDEGNDYGEWNGYGGGNGEMNGDMNGYGEEGDLNGADDFGGSRGGHYDHGTDFGHSHGHGHGHDQYQLDNDL